MVYVALLRGINVGGNAKVEMARLRAVFERLGLKDVRTHINSGNVIFTAGEGERKRLRQSIEAAIAAEFGLNVPVVLRDRSEMTTLVDEIPKSWVNDAQMKCDVMFLWPELDRPDILLQIPHKPELEDVKYYPGTLVWRVDRNKISRGRVLRIIGTDTYRQMTVRNVNTVRKVLELMTERES
jgi:uncharacterized protein (DUF1697 family)